MTEENTYLSEFINSIDVECPQCGSYVLFFSNKNNRSNIRFTCTSCGKSSKWEGAGGIFQSSGPNMEKAKFIALGMPFDCYFKFDLWYKFDFK